MAVIQLSDAAEVIDRVGEDRFRAASADAELSFGLLRRMVTQPDAWGPDVTMLLDLAGDTPRALASMAGSYPVLVVGFDDGVDHAGLVEAMLAAGRRPGGVNGAARWSTPHAEAWQAVGAELEPYRETVAYELRELMPPRPTPGFHRLARAADEDLLTEWMLGFGNEVGEPWGEEQARGSVRRLTEMSDVAVWEVDGELVSTAAINRRTPWSSTVALVFTPPALRGRGFAAVVVAELSRRELAAGAEWCSLFADLANPSANHVYSSIGYRPVTTFSHYALGWSAQPA